MGIDLGYATGRFRVPKELLPDSPLLYIVGPPPEQTKVGVIFQAENGVVLAGMGGYHGDHPPADGPGFLEFARRLSQPHIFRVLCRAELCGRIERYRIPASVRRRYEQMREFPERLVPVGDTICSLDPAFGQGMTMAALEGKILAQCMKHHSALDGGFTRDYFRRVNHVVDVAWGLSSRENLRYARATGKRPWFGPLESRYMNLLMRAGDAPVAAEIYTVISLSASPKKVLHPRVAARALASAARRGFQ